MESQTARPRGSRSLQVPHRALRPTGAAVLRRPLVLCVNLAATAEMWCEEGWGPRAPEPRHLQRVKPSWGAEDTQARTP